MSLRRKFVNSANTNKICTSCKKTYPRDDQHFYKKKHQSMINVSNYSPICITCDLKKSKVWKDNNTERKKNTMIKYLATERGYFKELWQSVKKSVHGCSFINYEEFFECWVEQQKIYGTKCPYYGCEMTRIKGINTEGKRRKATDTNISKDRILSSLPYCKDNLMFISWKANNEKGNITPFAAKKYLQFVDDIPSLKLITETEESIKYEKN